MPKGRAKGFMREDPALARATGVDGATHAGGGGGNAGGDRKKGKGDGSGSARRARPAAAVSLDRFARAKRSTYDKRVVLDKRRALTAGKVNKYRKVQERLKDEIERPEGFDPEEYARRLASQEASLPTETNADILAMAKRREGKGGVVQPPAAREVAPEDGHKNNEDGESGEGGGGVAAGEPPDDGMERMLRRMEANGDGEDGDGSDDEFAGNIVDGHRRKGKLGEGAKGVKGGKGWNKTVAAKIKADKAREEKRAEMKVLRARWAEEDAQRKRFFEKRNEGRDKFRKKTRRGQPVMKHRVDAILEKLQAGSRRGVD